MKLRCYCCGKTLGKHFVLVSMSEETDRVFVMAEDHVARAKDAELLIPVEAGETL
jgi:hypothetical protein